MRFSNAAQALIINFCIMGIYFITNRNALSTNPINMLWDFVFYAIFFILLVAIIFVGYVLFLKLKYAQEKPEQFGTHMNSTTSKFLFTLGKEVLRQVFIVWLSFIPLSVYFIFADSSQIVHPYIIPVLTFTVSLLLSFTVSSIRKKKKTDLNRK